MSDTSTQARNGPLDGVRVVDLTHTIAGAMATMVLSDQGAEVIKVEPPDGSPLRCYDGTVVWDRGKRSVVLDLEQDHDRVRLRELLATADVLVETFPPGTMERWGLDPQTIADELPALVHCSCTAYGSDGPRSDRPDHDILVQAATGVGYEQPGWRDGPIYLDLPIPNMAASYLILIAISAALGARERTGRGQRVATSLLQGVLAFTTQLWQQAEHRGDDYLGIGRVTQPGMYECADGLWVHSMHQSGGRGKDRSAFWTFLGLEPMERSTEPAEIQRQDRTIRAAVGRVTRDALLQHCWSNDIPIAPVRPAVEALADPLLVDAEQVVDVDDPELGPTRQLGTTFRLHRDPPARPRVGRARLGEHTDEVFATLAGRARPAVGDPGGPALSGGPLAGVRVVDLGNFLAGPYGPMILSDLGADVIKVEALAGDQMRFLTMPFNGCQRGKRDLALDLKTEQGREIVQRLIATADVVHHNMRPGVAERLGIDYATLSEHDPRLIYCHTTMWGLTGPRATWPGFDQLAQSSCGCEHGLGGEGNPPVWYRFGMCDQACAMQSAVAVLLALYRREQTGLGQFVDTSIVSGGLYLNSDSWIAGDRSFSRPMVDQAQTGPSPLYRLYRTADGWIAIACVDDAAWSALASVVPGLADDPRFASRAGRERDRGALAGLLEAAFAAGASAAWFAKLDGAGVPVEIADPDAPEGWLNDPDLIRRGLVAIYEHPTFGELRQFGSLIDFARTPGRIAGPPPLLGEHSVEVLTALGYDRPRIDQLSRDGITTWPGCPA